MQMCNGVRDIVHLQPVATKPLINPFGMAELVFRSSSLFKFTIALSLDHLARYIAASLKRDKICLALFPRRDDDDDAAARSEGSLFAAVSSTHSFHRPAGRTSLVVHSSVDIPPGANSKKRLKPELLYTEVARTVSAAVIAEMSYST